MFSQLLFLLAGFLLLIKGADYLVRGSASVAKTLGISTLVIGLTIVSFGTSAPELVVSMLSAWNGSVDLAVGNILGSNIANILLILGIVALIAPLKVSHGTVWKEIPLALLASLAVILLGYDAVLGFSSPFNIITRGDGLVLLMFFVIFLYYTYGVSRLQSENGLEIEHLTKPKAFMWIGFGMIGLVIGGKLIVDSAVGLVSLFGVSEHLIGVTVIAIGTSLPELATSVVAARKKHIDLAVGNLVGSNIFNVFFILAATAVVSPLPISDLAIRDSFFVVFVSLLLFFAMFIGKKRTIDKWQGASFVLLYVLYIIWSALDVV